MINGFQKYDYQKVDKFLKENLTFKKNYKKLTSFTRIIIDSINNPLYQTVKILSFPSFNQLIIELKSTLISLKETKILDKTDELILLLQETKCIPFGYYE